MKKSTDNMVNIDFGPWEEVNEEDIFLYHNCDDGDVGKSQKYCDISNALKILNRYVKQIIIFEKYLEEILQGYFLPPICKNNFEEFDRIDQIGKNYGIKIYAVLHYEIYKAGIEYDPQKKDFDFLKDLPPYLNPSEEDIHSILEEIRIEVDDIYGLKGRCLQLAHKMGLLEEMDLQKKYRYINGNWFRSVKWNQNYFHFLIPESKVPQNYKKNKEVFQEKYKAYQHPIFSTDLINKSKDSIKKFILKNEK